MGSPEDRGKDGDVPVAPVCSEVRFLGSKADGGIAEGKQVIHLPSLSRAVRINKTVRKVPAYI